MSQDRPTITPEERKLIDRHLAEHGATQCPTGAMATIPEYVYRARKGCMGRIVRSDGKSEWSNPNNGFYSSLARAKRLRGAEQ